MRVDPAQGPLSVDFTVAHDHGILVIEDSGFRGDHDAWAVDSEPAHATADSIYVAVLPEMEGLVTTSIRMASDVVLPADELNLIYEGRLEIASLSLLIGDSDRNAEVRIPVYSGACEIAVLVDEAGFASRVLVHLRPQVQPER